MIYILDKNALCLVYKIDLKSESSPRREYIYVDASDGDIVKVADRIRTTDAIGTAETMYNGVQPITTDYYNAQYRLRESGRGNGVETYDCNNSTSYYSAVDFTNTTNYWNTTLNQDNAAYDAHYGGEAAYDYFFNTFGRNSFNNEGAKIMSYTHYDYNYSNAFWDGSVLTFGDGDGYAFTPLTSIAVVAHEFSHGVTQYTADLIYENESGALNESFSDIFGICVDYFKHPSTANFQMGEEISLSSTPIRDCENPNNTGNPDTYLGLYWDPYQEVHQNSTVQSFWFYLLTNGGSGTNDIGNSYSVSGIGMDAAAAIAYRNLSVYLTPGSDYFQARAYSIEAAIDLYGACSNEVIACTNAWYAVGVGEQFSGTVVADFTASNAFSCSVPATINFINTSQNSALYHWTFGDGGTSNEENPVHTYTSAGTYSVSLKVTAPAECGGGSDSLMQSGYITVTDGGGPIPASCSPSTIDTNGYSGITNFRFNTINNTTAGALAGYEDFTCTSSTNVKEGKFYDLSVTLEADYYNHIKVWLDENNDGQFSGAELLLDSLFYGYTISKSLRIPFPVANNVPLRLRIGSDEGPNSLETACTDSFYGQYEDYSVVVQPNTDPPVADFTADITTVPIGTTVYFTDKSDNIVTSWQWTFQGGSSLHSTIQNPAITYNVLGSYAVKLKVSNVYGQDSITKTAYIQVVNSFNLCSGANTTALASGNLYDSGGPTGSYSDSESCTFLIENCGTSITLSFSEFQTESCCDYISVYDGADASGMLLMVYGGQTVPSPVTAHSGKMFINFYSDGSVTGSGFSAAWNSIIPNGDPPTGDFIISDINPPLNTPVEFTDNSSDDAISWYWNFGDSNTSAEQNPTHSYLSTGSFEVTCVVYNCFNSDTVQKSLEVQSAPSIAVSPSSLSVSLESCGATTSRTMNIANQNGGTLSYNFSATGSGNTINVLMLMNGVDVYEEGAHTIDAINQYFTDYTLTQATLSNAAEIETLLSGKDLVLIPEIENYPGSIYGDIASSLQAFVTGGGNVIFCGSYDYSSSIFATGLLSGSVAGAAYSSNITLTSEIHPITDGLPASFQASNATCQYLITSANTISLAKIESYDVILYRPLGQGNVVLLGFDYYEFDANAARIIANAVEWCGGGKGPSWLTLSPPLGNLTAGNNQQIDITFNSEGLSGGTYLYDLSVNSNDPLHPEISIPISLTVSGKPCASFGYNSDICSGVVAFRDSSFNNPTSWSWNFGDGITSNLRNPIHTYASPGNHLVNLIVCNTTDCDTAYLQVSLSSGGGPVAAVCIPSGANYGIGMGIDKVSFNTIQHRSVEDNTGYQDYTCTEYTHVNPGNSYPISLELSSLYQESVAVWIDYNNDGDFGSDEIVAQGNSSASAFTGEINIPATAVQNSSLRMRIGSDYYGYGSPTACSNTAVGQYEDYTVIVQPINVPPIADFVYSYIENCQGIVQFTNQSLNNATSYQWDFGDGGISFQENPIHIFTSPGTFPITLKAINSFGNNSTGKNIVANTLTVAITADSILVKNKHVYFNTNAEATTYNWDFGDGQNSSLKSPVHDYAAGGNFLVILTAIKDQCTYVTSLSVFIKDPDGIEESKSGNELCIYPNPGTGIFFLKLENEQRTEYHMEVRTTMGVIILKNILRKGDNQLTQKIDLSGYPSGTYTIILRDEKNKPLKSKLIKL
jgi:Zn-dependent metalloprotease